LHLRQTKENKTILCKNYIP